MAKDKDREIKPVSFNYKNDTDLQILKYLEENQIKFSIYVKQLILNDISKSNKNNTDLECVVNAINNLGNIIKNNSIIVEKSEDELASSGEEQEELYEDESKSIIKNILNMH